MLKIYTYGQRNMKIFFRCPKKRGGKVSARTFERELRRIKGTELGTETKQAVHKDYYGWTLKESHK